MSLLRRAARTAVKRLPTSAQARLGRLVAAARAREVGRALDRAGISGLEQNDINHLLHHLRGRELERLPKGVERFVSVGCAATWYFHWIERCCGPLGRHIGIEYYMPKPDDLPPNVDWIENTAGDMSLIGDETGDILFSGQNLEHLWPSDVAGFLRESYRVLKPGGLLVVDSPNRLVTRQLVWSHPEHTIELSPDEARNLIECSGFEVTALRGMWLCIDPNRGDVLRFDELQAKGVWPVERRVTEAHAHPNESFSWWIEARKAVRPPDSARAVETIDAIFRRAWPERVNRLMTIIGEPCELEGSSWLRSRGESGVLMYGPYMPLPAGEYKVWYELRRDSSSSTGSAEIARVDVIAGSGQQLVNLNIRPDQFNTAGSTLVLLAFRLDALTFGIQFRVIAMGAEHVMVRRAVKLRCQTNPDFDAPFPLNSASS